MAKCSRLESGRAETLRGFESHPRRVSSATTIQIKGRPKVKTLAYSAGIALAGMAVLALTLAFNWGESAVTIGLALAGLGIGFVIVAQEAARKSSVVARLDEDGFLLSSSRTRYGLPWKDVRRVSMAGNRITIRDNKGQDASVVAPPGAGPEELDALAAEMIRRLDASRGYGQIT